VGLSLEVAYLLAFIVLFKLLKYGSFPYQCSTFYKVKRICMAPHVWQGPTAALYWYKDVLIEGEARGASGYFVTLGDPLHNNVTNDSAYVVLPATMKFDVKGTKVEQTGAVFTVAFRKTVGGWRVAAWAWAKGANKSQ
jgi:hypothetical protein